MPKFNPFTTMQVDVPNTNTFDLSHDNKLTLDMGKLYPVLVQETLPGDYFQITPEMLLRFAPMTFPIMHRIDASIHFFYVPNRISWSNWGKFLAGEDYMPPYIQGNDEDEQLVVQQCQFLDYIGLPNSSNIQVPINALPILAYWRIFNEYYQDQNNDPNYNVIRDQLETLLTHNGRLSPTDFFTASYENLPLFRRAYEHDYFTSCLPFAQKGEAVNIPLQIDSFIANVEASTVYDIPGGGPSDGTLSANGLLGGVLEAGGDLAKIVGQANINGDDVQLTGTINQLRTAMALQKFLEKNARSGTRYNELIKAHFGEDIGDARISRPEYLGGIKNNIIVSEVLQTSQTSDDSALGDYAGHGTGVVSGNTITYRTPEHGFIIAILSVMPKTAYFQGIDRKFSRMAHLDYYWKEFANIGEQAVLNKEIYYSASAGSANNDTFGYIPRYSEYKYSPSQVHGDFRVNLLDWHLARDFGSIPPLNEEFVYSNPDQMKRIFAVTDVNTNSLYAHIYFDIQAKRKIPFFTNPGGI